MSILTIPPSIRSSTWVVVPAFNEEQTLRQVVKELTDLGLNIVVVDDCSAYPQKNALKGLAVSLCRHNVNLGQGGALRTGFMYALSRNAKIIITFDADGQHQTEDISKLIEPILQKRAEVVFGSRFFKNKHPLSSEPTPAIPLQKKILLKTATVFMNILLRTRLTDTHNGFRAFTRDALVKLKLSQNGMSHASEIIQEVVKREIPFCEVPVTILYTEYSLKKGQKIRNSFNILWDMTLQCIRK
jgi:polyprenyl-phospho-N-acetylgalactosaminyl synthase